MKKKLSILMLLAALIVPWASRAQNCTQTVPYSENFESYAGVAYNATSGRILPTCWNGYSTIANYIPCVVSGTGSYVYYHGAKSMAMTGGTATTYGMNKYVLLPPMNVPLSQLQLSFWMCTESSSATYGVLHVGYVTSDDTATFVSIANYPSSTATYHGSNNGLMAAGIGLEVELALSQVPASATRLAFKWEHANSSYHTCCIDDVVVDYLPTCPRVDNLTAMPGTDEVVLSWLEMGTATEWEVTLTDATGVATTDLVTSNPATITNLTPNTAYNATVRAVCGYDDTSLTRGISFRTACMPVDSDSLPWIYGFEDASANAATATFNPCLGRHVEGSTTAWPYPSATHHGSGAHSLYMYSTSAIHSWLTLPLFDEDLDQLQLSFYAYRSTTATYGHWAVGVMTDPSDITTFDTIASGQVSQNSLWELVEVPLNNYTGNGTYLAILCPKGSAANYTYVDDITVGYLPSCITPTNIVGSNATSNTVDVSWTSTADEFIIEYGLQGFTQGTGDSVTSATNSVTLNNLRMGMTYSVYVTAVCGSDTSNTAYGTVTTGCATITSSDLPYMEDFETYGSGVAYPINACWTKGTSSSTAYPYPTNTVVSGARSLYFYGYHPSSTSTTPVYSWAALPPVDDDLDISTLQINFKVKRGSTASTYYTTLLYVGIAESVTGLTSAAAIDTQVTWIDTLNYYSTASSSANSIHDAEVTFDTYTGTGKYIVIYAPVPPLQGSSTYAYNYAYVDDIALRTIPTCFWPTAVSLNSVTSDEATLSWTPDPRTPNPNGWSVEYGLHGFTPGGGTVSSESTTSATLTNLLPNTEYDVYVSADCGSEMSDPAFFSFRTECTALDTLPYVQDFENEATTTSTSYDFAPCMHRLNNGTQYFGYPYIANSTTYNHTTGGTKGLYWYGCSTTGTYGDYQIVVLPAVDTNIYPINTLQLRFWAKSSSTSYHPVFQVGVMTNPYDASTFQRMETVDVGTNTTWTEFTVALGAYTGQGQYVAIKAVRPSSSWYAYVDDITLELMPPCPAIVGIEAATTVGSAVLTWDWQSGYDAPAGYVVTYDSIGGTSPTTVNVTTNNAVITGLAANTTYEAYVMADCGSDGFGRMDSVTFTTGDFGCVELDPASIDSVIFSNSTTGQSGCLAYSSYGNTAYQAIWTATELTAAGLSAGPITGIDLGFTASTYSKEFTIFIGNTTTTSIASTTFEVPTEEMRVYGPAAHPSGTSGWQHYDFTTPFNWDGTSSIIITTFMNQPSGTSQTVSTDLKGYYTSASNRARYRYKDSNPFTLDNVSSTGTAASTYSYRASIHFHIAECQTQAVCADPSVIVTDMDTASVTIAWAPGADETDWDIAYRVAGAATWTTEATSVSTNSYTFTGLTPATDYEFRVSFECSDGTVYQGIATATTPCAPMPLPYTENFDNISTSTTAANNYGVMPLCWDYTLTGTSSYTTGSYLPGVYYGAAYAASGSYCLRLAGVGVFELPEMGAPLDSLRISFSDTITSASYNGLVVGVVENGQFLPIDTVDLALGTRNYIEVMLSDYHGTSRTIALKNFYATSTTTYYSYQYIDDLVVDYIPQCSHVNNLTADSIGEDVVVLSWTPVGASATWLVVNGADSVVVADSSVTITGLSPNTPYTFEVYSLCGTGDTSEVASIDVRTACTVMPVPFYDNFDSYTSLFVNTSSSMVGGMVPCWDYLPSAGGGYMTFVNSGTYLYGGSGMSLKFKPGTATSHDVVALPLFALPISSLEMTFQTRPEGTSSSPGSFDVGYIANVADASTFVVVEHYDYSDFNGNYQEKTVTFAGAPATARIAFRHNTASAAYYWFVDEVDVHEAPSCNRPMSVSVNGVTTTAANVHITDTTNVMHYRLYFDNGTAVDSVDIYDTTYTITTLQPSSVYTLSVRSLCAAGDITSAVRTSFATVCGQIALPVFYDPDNYTTGTTAALPNCWTRTNNSTGSYNYYPYIYSSSANAHSGSNTLYYYFSTSSGYSTDALMAFPEIDVTNFPMNNTEVIFWAKSSVANKPFMVGVMTNPAVASTFVAVDTITLTTTVSEYTVSLDNYTGNGTYIALRGVMSGTSSYYIYVDDIYIGVMSHCPRAYNLTAYNGTATGATLAWTDTIGSTQWVVEYHAYGDTVMHTVTANSNPFTLTGLTANTIYNYRVAPICSDGVQADWSRETFAFATSQVPATVPYSYDFENGTEWANWQTLSNNTVNWSRGNAVGHPGYSMYLSTDSGATRSYNMSAITNAAVYRDFDFGPTPVSYELTYDALIGGSTDGNYDGITIMVVDPAVIPVSSSTGLTSPWGHISTVDARLDTVWSGESYYLDGMQGVKRLVFFHFNQATASSHPFVDSPDAIDNIAIGVQPCARPYNLTADNITEHSAQLSWAGPATDTYIVAYRVYGAAAATNVYATVTGNSYVLNGLNSNTGYVYWVDHICSMTATDTLASDWSNGYRFATACGYTSLPYSEGFEGVTGHGYNAVGELPSCWGSYTDGTQAKYAPHVVDSGTYANYPHTGTKCLGMVSGSSTDFGTTKIAALPPFNAPISTLKMKFWYRMESASYGTLSVGYVTNLADLAGSFVQVHEVTSTTTVTQDSVSFDNVPANALQIAFRWYHNGTWYTVGIDDIEVWSTGPVCNNPTSLHATAVAYNSVSVAWSGTDSAEVGIHQGLWDETGATIATVTTNSYTFTGLTPNMQYTIAARNLCPDDMTSDWVYLSVTTDDLPCFAPTNIQVSNETTNGGKVTWTRGGDETEWIVNVFRTGVVDTNITVINTPMCNISGLYADMSYTISVASVCGGIDTVWCDTTATLTTTACLPPTNVTAVANGHQAIVTWEGTGANEYHVLWFLQGFTTDGDSVIATNGTTNATIDGLQGGEDYDIYVYAYCDGQRSAQAGQTQLHVTGIDDINTSAINLYPNPANTTVTVDGIEGEALVTIVDMNGRTVFSEKTVSSITIDLGGMAKGAYFVRITGENSSAIRKLIVK